MTNRVAAGWPYLSISQPGSRRMDTQTVKGPGARFTVYGVLADHVSEDIPILLGIRAPTIFFGSFGWWSPDHRCSSLPEKLNGLEQAQSAIFLRQKPHRRVPCGQTPGNPAYARH